MARRDMRGDPSMRHAFVAVALVGTMLLAGCASLDSLTIADVPSDRRASGWSFDQEQSEKGEVNAGPLTVAAFASRVYQHSDTPQGAMAVVTVSDVPLADIKGRIREQFQQVLQDRNVQRTERRSGQMSVDGYTADYTLYDAEIQRQAATVEGFVLEHTYTCSDSGTVVGFLGLAATEIQTAFGGGQDMQTWHEVAGSNWENEFGGMSKQVKCRA